MLMTENAHGSFGSMGMLSELRIPAHGQASLVPGHDHVMLEQPTVTFKVGQTVLVTLRFKWAGSVTYQGAGGATELDPRSLTDPARGLAPRTAAPAYPEVTCSCHTRVTT